MPGYLNSPVKSLNREKNAQCPESVLGPIVSSKRTDMVLRRWLPTASMYRPEAAYAALRRRLSEAVPRTEVTMTDRIEIVLQEIAILRGEVAHLHTMLEQANESLRDLNVTFLKRISDVAELIHKLEAQLPTVSQ